MFDSIALDVVIGLIFIYLMYSLLATTINEGIASIFSLRAKKLEQALSKMLNDGVNYHENFWVLLKDYFIKKWKWITKSITFFHPNTKHKTKEEMNLLELFYDHPGIKYLGENKIHNKPAYLSPEFFSKALIDVLKNKGLDKDLDSTLHLKNGIEKIDNNCETKGYIESLLVNVNSDEAKFKLELEKWFNETMHRTSGWYKKQSQRITFVIGFTIAIAFNVDTISIVKHLSHDKDAAKNLTDLSSKYVEAHKDKHGKLSPQEKQNAEIMFQNAKSQIDSNINSGNSLIGLGWPDSLIDPNKYQNGKHVVNHFTFSEKVGYIIRHSFTNGRSLLGYLITALAISFGAPFWFDLLNKFMQLRGSGKQPEPTPNSETEQTNSNS